MQEKKRDTLYVKTFGGFSMEYNGVLVTGGGKSSETQFIYLMQLLLHRGSVSRDFMEELLYEDREIDDKHHAMRSVVYNAKRTLRECGLPDVDYITQKRGVYYWTDQIPVVEDAAEFDRLYQKIQEEEDEGEKLELCLAVCDLYSGEFLAQQAGIIWVANEARRYRDMFRSCVKESLRLLREKGDFFRMEELGRYVSIVCPAEGWEDITMEALVSQGRYKDAEKLYDETVDFYYEKYENRPSGPFVDVVDKMADRIENGYSDVESIKKDLQKPGKSADGGVYCTYPVFRGIYRMLQGMTERLEDISLSLMLCTLQAHQGLVPREDNLERMTKDLGEAILSSLRRYDTVCRYGAGQFLVLLVDVSEEQYEKIKERITRKFNLKKHQVQNKVYYEIPVSIELFAL